MQMPSLGVSFYDHDLCALNDSEPDGREAVPFWEVTVPGGTRGKP
jgi:hypothetical protein